MKKKEEISTFGVLLFAYLDNPEEFEQNIARIKTGDVKEHSEELRYLKNTGYIEIQEGDVNDSIRLKQRGKDKVKFMKTDDFGLFLKYLSVKQLKRLLNLALIKAFKSEKVNLMQIISPTLGKRIIEAYYNVFEQKLVDINEKAL